MSDDPFARLGALDQQLYQTPPPRPTVAPPQPIAPIHPSPRKTVTKTTTPSSTASNRTEGGKEGSREVGNPPSPAMGRWGPAIGNLGIKPYRKDSYLFTDAEFNAMDELKLDLRKAFELLATKNEIARVALQFLLYDYEEHGEASYLVKALQTKGGK